MQTELTIVDNSTTALANFLNHYLALLTLVGFVLLIFWLIVLIYVYFTNKKIKLFSVIGEYVLPLGFLISFAGMLLSLFYSQVLG